MVPLNQGPSSSRRRDIGPPFGALPRAGTGSPSTGRDDAQARVSIGEAAPTGRRSVSCIWRTGLTASVSVCSSRRWRSCSRRTLLAACCRSPPAETPLASAWGREATLCPPYPVIAVYGVAVLVITRSARLPRLLPAVLLAAACLVSFLSGFFDGQLARADLSAVEVTFQARLLGVTALPGIAALFVRTGPASQLVHGGQGTATSGPPFTSPRRGPTGRPSAAP
jgi:hypothetical protein